MPRLFFFSPFEGTAKESPMNGQSRFQLSAINLATNYEN